MLSSTVFALCFLVAMTAAGTIGRASYGEECNRDIRCDSRNFLTCFNDRCSCLMPDIMAFDNFTNKCVSLAGERCLYTTIDAERTWTDEVPCVPNSACQQGICECGPQHYEISNGTCQLKKGYGEACRQNVMCDNSKYLTCGSQQSCSCASGRIYDDRFNMCLRPAGQHCENSADVECVANAHCESESRCSCVKGYFQTESGTCEEERGLGEPCNENIPCIFYRGTHDQNFHDEPQNLLTCDKGQCLCNPEYSMEFTDEGTRHCGKLVGVRCSEGECFPGAECRGICECKNSSYVQTANKTCQLKRAYGMPCSDNIECVHPFVCDAAVGECRCDHEKAFHLGSCAVAPGYSCDYEDCVPGAVCTSDDFGNHKCVCTSGTVQGNSFKRGLLHEDLCFISENDRCYGDTYSGRGNTEKICLPGLRCKNGSCSCEVKEHQVYKEDQNECLALVDGPCARNEDCEDENAECVMEANEQQSSCRCQAGFVQFGRECTIPYGQKCSQKKEKPRCDQLGPLECTTDETCKCPILHIYDRKTMTCKGLHGATCKVQSTAEKKGNNDDFCVAGAMCKGFRGFENVVGVCTCQFGTVSKRDRLCKEPEALGVATSETWETEFPITPEDDEISYTRNDLFHDY